MDVPRKYSWAELKQLAANRDYWRNRVKALREGSSRVEENTRGPHPSPCKRRANRRHTTTTNPPKPTTSSPSAEAKRYKARDAHEAFFRPLTESPRKRNRHAKHKRPKCKKSRSLTDKERQEAARLHWDLNHGMPEILGHTATAQPRTDLTMAPIHFNELMEYFDNETMHQDNLKNLSDLLDDI